jgi:hypothetical protein
MVCNCRFYKEINNAIILIDSNKALIKIKQSTRHIMPIRMRYAVTNGEPTTPSRCSGQAIANEGEPITIRRSHRLWRGYMFLAMGELLQ